MAPPIRFSNPWGGQNPFTLDSFPQPTTVLTIENGMRPPYIQQWNLSVERSFASACLIDLRYIGTNGTRLPRMIDQRRLYAGCHPPGGPCDFASVGLITDSTDSTYHAGQLAITNGLSFLASYTYSKSLDDVSSFNVAGSAPHGPSLFDTRHRVVLSGTYEVPFPHSTSGAARAMFAGWQLNAIANFASGTPFTVYDSANAALQASAPEISGLYSSRPDLVGDPNAGPHSPDAWTPRSAFQRLDPAAQAGQFGNEGRNAVRGPGLANIDVSAVPRRMFQRRQSCELRHSGQ